MFRPPTTREMLAQSRAAQAVEEKLRVFPLRLALGTTTEQATAEDLTLTVLAIYRAALDERVVVTALHRHDNVIGGINMQEANDVNGNC